MPALVRVTIGTGLHPYIGLHFPSSEPLDHHVAPLYAQGMASELHELRAVLAQALKKIDDMLAYKPNPYLPVLQTWLGQAWDRQMLANQLYVLVNIEFAEHDLPHLSRQDIADLMRFLGYTNKRTSAGMKWQLP